MFIKSTMNLNKNDEANVFKKIYNHHERQSKMRFIVMLHAYYFGAK